MSKFIGLPVQRDGHVTCALRNTGLPVLGEVPWGVHLCLFHQTKRDLLDALIPYFRSGLESNELCMWAVSDQLTVNEAVSALRRDIPDFDHFLTSGSIEILPGSEWYISDHRVDAATIMARWHEKLENALRRGYEGMRVSGNAFWLQSEYWTDFHLYEQELNGAFDGQPMIALCTYPLGASRPADILEVALAHQVTIARRNGHWEIIQAAGLSTETDPLTPREREVLKWVARGKSAWEIGGILGIGKRTVDEHAQVAIRKLGASNRAQAVAIAVNRRLIDVRSSHSAERKIG